MSKNEESLILWMCKNNIYKCFKNTRVDRLTEYIDTDM